MKSVSELSRISTDSKKNMGMVRVFSQAERMEVKNGVWKMEVKDGVNAIFEAQCQHVKVMIPCPPKRSIIWPKNDLLAALQNTSGRFKGSIIWPRPKNGSIICPTKNMLSTDDENEVYRAFLHGQLATSRSPWRRGLHPIMHTAFLFDPPQVDTIKKVQPAKICERTTHNDESH